MHTEVIHRLRLSRSSYYSAVSFLQRRLANQTHSWLIFLPFLSLLRQRTLVLAFFVFYFLRPSLLLVLFPIRKRPSMTLQLASAWCRLEKDRVESWFFKVKSSVLFIVSPWPAATAASRRGITINALSRTILALPYVVPDCYDLLDACKKPLRLLKAVKRFVARVSVVKDEKMRTRTGTCCHVN